MNDLIKCHRGFSKNACNIFIVLCVTEHSSGRLGMCQGSQVGSLL